MSTMTHFLFRTLIISLMLLVSGICQAQSLLYSWQSPNGIVEEQGGKLEHFNQNGHDLRNIKCGDYYTFVLNGDHIYINADYNVDECSYMKLTLNEDHVFHAGDEIEITAMRNNVADRPASIYFLFHTTTGETEIDVPLIDTHVWNNLGQGKDDTFSGDIGGNAKQNVVSLAATSATTTSFYPSTYTFIVPKEADGAKYVRLTRYETGNMLFLSHFIVRRPTPSAISVPSTESFPTQKVRKYIRGGKLMISSDNKLYEANGVKCASYTQEATNT